MPETRHQAEPKDRRTLLDRRLAYLLLRLRLGLNILLHGAVRLPALGAFALAREGASVIVNGRTEERVAAAVKTILQRAPDTRVSGVVADLASAAGAEGLCRQVPETDILVNNLGIFEAKPFADISDEDWRHTFEVNVMSGVWLSRHYLPTMLRKNWGRIIFISSESAVNIPAEMIHYGVTKTAQVALARGVAETTVGTGVTVNSILAGPTRSEGAEGFVKRMAEQQSLDAAAFERPFFERARPSSLLKRFETPEEVAALVAFVAGELASAINGAALRVEGGVLRGILGRSVIFVHFSQ
jgi:NAD(P)-dependent dehydrogenase (short-subunit alcohol dehydrogenase family)